MSDKLVPGASTCGVVAIISQGTNMDTVGGAGLFITQPPHVE